MNATLKAGLILLVVFALGAMAGIATMRVKHEPPRRGPSNDPFRKDPELVDHIERRLVDHYELTEEQRVAVRRILMDAQKKYDDFFRKPVLHLKRFEGTSKWRFGNLCRQNN